MDIQRLRNLTTGRLHTEVGHIYKDLEYITGMEGLFTHMLPNVMRAVEPWLREQVRDDRFWDDEYDTTHVGDFDLRSMDDGERRNMLQRYGKLPHPFAKRDPDSIVTVIANDQPAPAER